MIEGMIERVFEVDKSAPHNCQEMGDCIDGVSYLLKKKVHKGWKVGP